MQQLKFILFITIFIFNSCPLAIKAYADTPQSVIQGSVSATEKAPVNGDATTNDAASDAALTGSASTNGSNSTSFRLNRPLNNSISTDSVNTQASNVQSNVIQMEISKQELHMLGLHDVTLLIDKSGSMATTDCPSPKSNKWGKYLNLPLMMTIGTTPFLISRWRWCQLQTMRLADISNNYLEHGMTVVVFSSSFKVYKQVRFTDIASIFQANHPSGGTNTTDALVSQIRDYFERRLKFGSRVKPLIIAIITDGVPDNPFSLKRAIIEATWRMNNPNEISIAFLQIGGSFFGYHYLQELEYGLLEQGAKFDIVSVKTFSQLVREGLSRGLMDAIEENEKNNQPRPLP